MNADLRCFSIVVLLLALMGSDSAAQPPDEAEKEAVAAIEKLGGLVRRNQGQGSSVRLSTTKVGDAGLVHLKGLTRLQSLNLNDTKVSDAGLVNLKGLTRLRSLTLNNTKVSDAGLVHLKGMTQLQWLYLKNTNVTDKGVKSLKAA